MWSWWLCDDQDGVDLRQVLEADPGGPAALDADRRDGALGPGRVGQDVDAVHLDEQRRVIDHRHGDLAVAHLPGRCRAKGRFRNLARARVSRSVAAWPSRRAMLHGSGWRSAFRRT